MAAYYNDNDRNSCDWLRELIKRDLIANGEVDERSIWDVRSRDLAGFSQCHLFAGIGGWSYALRLAGWPDNREVWTGSCPCQPFSVAGKGKGIADERHLWPAFHWLIKQSRPSICFGEQVAGASGREWFSDVRDDLEGLGYAVGASDLCAASVGAPHIRQRIFWVGYSDSARRQRASNRSCGEIWAQEQSEPTGAISGMANTYSKRFLRADAQSEKRSASRTGMFSKFWTDIEWCTTSDGKTRPIKSGICPVAHGISGRVGRIRGYGNAIVPQVAALFIEAFETRHSTGVSISGQNLERVELVFPEKIWDGLEVVPNSIW